MRWIIYCVHVQITVKRRTHPYFFNRKSSCSIGFNRNEFQWNLLVIIKFFNFIFINVLILYVLPRAWNSNLFLVWEFESHDQSESFLGALITITDLSAAKSAFLIDDENSAGSFHAIFFCDVGVADNWNFDILFSSCSVRWNNEKLGADWIEIISCCAVS